MAYDGCFIEEDDGQVQKACFVKEHYDTETDNEMMVVLKRKREKVSALPPLEVLRWPDIPVEIEEGKYDGKIILIKLANGEDRAIYKMLDGRPQEYRIPIELAKRVKEILEENERLKDRECEILNRANSVYQLQGTIQRERIRANHAEGQRNILQTEKGELEKENKHLKWRIDQAHITIDQNLDKIVELEKERDEWRIRAKNSHDLAGETLAESITRGNESKGLADENHFLRVADTELTEKVKEMEKERDEWKRKYKDVFNLWELQSDSKRRLEHELTLHPVDLQDMRNLFERAGRVPKAILEKLPKAFKMNTEPVMVFAGFPRDVWFFFPEKGKKQWWYGKLVEPNGEKERHLRRRELLAGIKENERKVAEEGGLYIPPEEDEESITNEC